MATSGRTRLDEAMVARGLAASRSAAQALIMAGLVSVSGKITEKSGTLVDSEATISVKERPRFVSRGGEKLCHALTVFNVDVAGVSALDVGASTGGFVDCLLQKGAQRVIALDVGRGQLDWRIRCDPRVTVLEKINARYLTPGQLPFVPDFVTVDVSFISVTKVLPAVVGCLTSDFAGLILIKPQFEAGPEHVGKGGIIRDPEVHRQVLRDRARFMVDELGVRLLGICPSGLTGTDGNQEFFMYIAGSGSDAGVPSGLNTEIAGFGTGFTTELEGLEALIDEALRLAGTDPVK